MFRILFHKLDWKKSFAFTPLNGETRGNVHTCKIHQTSIENVKGVKNIKQKSKSVNGFAEVHRQYRDPALKKVWQVQKKSTKKLHVSSHASSKP